MSKYKLPPMRPELAVCPRCGSESNGRIGIHSHPERRYKCHRCGKTFSDRYGTPLYGLKAPTWQVVVVLTLLAYGCPRQARPMGTRIAFGLDERTVSTWQRKAGLQAKGVQEAMVCTGAIDGGQVQGDEFYLRTQCGGVWLATAMSVFSRLFLWGAVSVERKCALVTQVVTKVKAAVQPNQPLLWAVDGFGAWTQAILHHFRVPCHTGKPGRPALLISPHLPIVQVIKHRLGRQLCAIERRLLQGSRQGAEVLLSTSQCDFGCFNTAYIERLNATLRTWLPAATRRSRTPAARRLQLEAAFFWTAVVYNFAHVHASLQATPAMAAGLTTHVWSIDQLLRFRSQPE